MLFFTQRKREGNNHIKIIEVINNQINIWKI